METTESLKCQLDTAEDLLSLVKTMKALAAVNIRQLEQAVDSLSEFKRTIEMGLRVVLRARPDGRFISRTAHETRLGAVVFGSDQGMCGPLNDQIAAFAARRLVESGVALGDRVTLAVGSRVASRLEDLGEAPETVLPAPSSTAGVTPFVQALLLHIERWHTEQKIGRVLLFFSEHVSRAGYRPAMLELLPIDRRWLENLERQPWPGRTLPTFSMDRNWLFSSLVHEYLFISLYRAMAESLASENASRLASMRGAERNIGERIGDLRLRYHQQRQMAITEELLDITAGFEALADAASENE